MPLNIDLQQILLHLLNFVVLFAVLYFLLYKPVKQFMDKRTAYYKELEDEARQNLADSEAAKTAYAEKLSHAEEEIAESKETARKELETSLAAKRKQAEEEAARVIAEARNSAEKERSKILEQAQGEIADMVTSATEKIVLGADTSEAFDRFLSAAQRGENNE